MKNAIVHLGNLYKDHGGLRRRPQDFLEPARARLIERHGPLDGYMFGRMNDDGDYKVVSVDDVVLDRPVLLDITTGRHTGIHETGPRKGKVKGGGPHATDIDDVAAENLLADIEVVNRKLQLRERLKMALDGATSRPVPSSVGPLEVHEVRSPERVTTRREDEAEALREFSVAVSGLPRATEVERYTVERIGQPFFRRLQLKRWGERCAITGMAIPELLRASHLKPWAKCDSDAERLAVANGLLLSPGLDAALDKGFITLTDEGVVQVSSRLDAFHRSLLGLDKAIAVKGLGEEYRPFLSWHRTREFKP